MNNIPAEWTAHSRETVNDQVAALLNGVTIPPAATDKRRCEIIQACAHIAINLMCDLSAGLPGSDAKERMVSTIEGIAALNKDMVAHVVRRFQPTH